MARPLQPLFVSLPFRHERKTPSFLNPEDKYPESLVRYFLQQYTKKGDNVLDPFMGTGTTAFVCEDMGRIPFGVEHDQQRYEWTAGQLTHWENMRWGDAGKISSYRFPKMDFCITSPPYMPCHHRWNPLYGGDPAHAGYESYLRRMGKIFKDISGLMKKGAPVLVQLDNLQHGKVYTPLVRDISLTLEKNLKLEAEIIVPWKNPKPDYRHTHCLLFRNIGK